MPAQKSCRRRAMLVIAALGWMVATALAAPTLTVCMAEDNAPLSHLVTVKGQAQVRGLDQRIAAAVASDLGRALVVLPFDTSYEKESTLGHEVNALLSSGLCEAASGFPLLAVDLGPPSRATARTPDYPGAKRKRDRPFVPLSPLAASRAYLAATLGVVQRTDAAAAPLANLADLGARRLAVVSGTLAGSTAMTWRQGALRSQLVSLGQREDPLAELARPEGSPRFDAVFLPLALFDGWRLQNPGSPLTAAAMRRPVGVNLGFVTLAAAAELRAVFDRVISQARRDGGLARWATEEGVSWAAPTLPEISNGPTLADLAAD